MELFKIVTCVIIPFLLVLGGSFCYHPHFVDEEIEHGEAERLTRHCRAGKRCPLLDGKVSHVASTWHKVGGEHSYERGKAWLRLQKAKPHPAGPIWMLGPVH
jgi:hypothetical protein